MQKDRWKEITRIFHAALDLPPEDRHGFVCTAASGDPDIQSEVEQLLLADREAESYLELPLIPPGAIAAALSGEPELRPGDILCQRFHILRAVGSGGMGQVFEAHDSELAVNVALKLIRPEIAANPQALARFRQEVRLARRITHPNVCRTFDLDRDALTTPEGPPRTLVFLTMEFLAGETLAARLKRAGRLTLDEILAITRQIAAALDAAHALGIVHRDIKPGNIMLVPAGENSRQPARVVITDFGLARLDPVFSHDENSITQHSSHSAHPIGTLAYMAPEQMDGSPISAATDIYAFGLVLFEMATGQRAFPSSNLLSGIAQRLSGPPPSPTSLQPALPASLEQAVQGCLRLKPEERFQSAQAVLECLTGQSQPLPTPAIRASKPQPSPRRTNWTARNTVLAAAAILLLAVSLFLLGLRYHWWEGNARLDPGALVYLAPVTNQTGEKSLDNITELLQASLEQSAHINLLEQGRVGDILQTMTKPADTPIDQPIGREIAMRANASRVIFAQVTGSQGHYTLNIDIQRTDYTPVRFRSHWPKSFPWQVSGNTNSGAIPQELTSTVGDATDWIRREVGESRDDIASLDVPPEDVTTSSWEALRDFSLAKRLIKEGNKSAAIRSLQRATNVDPGFASAYAELATNLMSVFRTDEALAAYNKAVSIEFEGRLSTRERYFIIASHASDTNDMHTAAEAFKSYTDLYPNDYLGWFYLAYPLRELGRGDEATYALERSLRLHSQGAGIRAALAVTYIAMEQGKRASDLISEIDKNQYPDEAYYTAGILAFLEKHYDESERSFTRIQSGDSQVFKAFGYSMLARVEAERGRTELAIHALEEGISESEKSNDLGDLAAQLIDKAYLLCNSGRFPQCFQALDGADSEPLDPNHWLIESYALGTAAEAGSAPVRQQSISRLRKLLDSANKMSDSVIVQIARDRLKGELDAALANWKGAIDDFKSADKLDAVISDRAYLARTLAHAAAHEANATKAESLRHEARSAYEKTILHPGRSWHEAWIYQPGLLADEMQSYLQLCGPKNSITEGCRSAAEGYKSLREGSKEDSNRNVGH